MGTVGALSAACVLKISKTLNALNLQTNGLPDKEKWDVSIKGRRGFSVLDGAESLMIGGAFNF